MITPLTGTLTPLAFQRRRAALQTWHEYVAATIQPVLWYRLNEASGNLIDYGSAGVNATPNNVTGLTYQQPGPLGATEAVEWNNAAQSNFNTAYAAAWADLTSFEYTMLVDINAAGTGLNQRLFGLNIGPLLSLEAGINLRCTVRGTGNGDAIGTNVVNPGSKPYLLSCWFEDSGDRKPHITVDGIEVAYTTQTAVTGTYQKPTNGMTWGNNQIFSLRYRGIIDEIMISRVLTSGERATLKTLAPGV